MAFADRLEPGPEDAGIEPLIDRSEIYAFEDWWQRIESLIVRSDTIVSVLSRTLSSDVAARRSRSRPRSTRASRLSSFGP
jgi:hypothetical protein